METYETMPRGDSAVCGRRVSFWMSRKKPMAQATFSWPFGPIHLERHQGAAQDERSALIFAAPGPHYGGRPPERLCRVSGAQNLSDLPQFNPGPLGPCVCKNFRFCHSTTAPEFAEPTITVRRWPLPGPLAGIPRRRSGTASLKFSSHQGPVARVEPHPSTPFLRAGHKRPRKGEFPRKQGSGERRIWTRSVHPEPSPAAFW